MRWNWKRMLAAFLAACMILGDSSVVFAAELDSITEETVVEETVIEEENVIAEETIAEEPEAIVEETITEEELETVVEETVTEDPEVTTEEIVVEEFAEVSTEEVKNTFFVVEQDEEITADFAESYYAKVVFTPEKSGYYGASSTAVYACDIWELDEDGECVDYSQSVGDYKKIWAIKEEAYDFEDIIEAYYLEANTTYELSFANMSDEDEVTFSIMEAKECNERLSIENNQAVVPAYELKMFELSADEAKVVQLNLTGCFTYQILGDSYGLFVDGDDELSCHTVSIPKGKKLYYVVLPDEEINIEYSEPETTKIEVGEVKAVEAGTTKFFEFVPDPKKETFISNFDYIKNVFIIGNDGFDYSYQYGCPYEDTMGNSLYLLPRMKNIEKVIFSASASEYSEENFSISNETTGHYVINEWTDQICLNPGESRYVSYSGRNYGEYFVLLPEGVSKSDYGWSSNISAVGSEELSIAGGYYEGYQTRDCYTDEDAHIEFVLTNNTDEIKVVPLLSNEDFACKEIESDRSYTIEENNYDANQGAYFEYYSFTPEVTSVYSMDGDFQWAYCKETGEFCFVENVCSLLEEGKTYLFKGMNYGYSDGTFELELVDTSECYGSGIDPNDRVEYYLFTPSYTGTYSSDDEFRVFDWDTNEWNWGSDNNYEVELIKDQQYLLQIWGNEFGLRSKVTVLDYDYYYALIQSGGSVTVEDGDVIIQNGTNEFTLFEKLLSIFGLYFYGDVETKVWAKANRYWKHPDSGEFVGMNVYDLNGQCINLDYVEDGDVVLVKYAPEIVWVDKMTVTLENANISTGETTNMIVSLKPATEKYPFTWIPEIRVASNGILKVGEAVDVQNIDDGKEIIITYPVEAVKAGKAEVNVYADEQLRIQEGLKADIVKGKVSTVVGNKYSITYVSDKVEAANDNPLFYVSGNTVTLNPLQPVEEEPGYEFAGWYSDSAYTKKVTQITAKMTGNKTFYAKWVPAQYEIHYEYPVGINPESNPLTYTIESETIILKELILNGHKTKWIDCATGNEITEIPTGSKGDLYVTAEYECTADFYLSVSSAEIQLPYNEKISDWDSAKLNVGVESNPQGMYIDTNSLVLGIYQNDELVNEEKAYLSGHDVYFLEPGNYTIKGSYCYNGAVVSKEVLLEGIDVTVTKELPVIPINKEIEWREASNLRANLKYQDIRKEIEKQLLGEEIEELLSDISCEMTIKNAKGIIIKDTAAVKSGDYIVEYKLQENDIFQSKIVEAKLKIVYSPIELKDFVYVSGTLDGNRDDERTAGPVIAYPVEIDGNFVNTSAYPVRVVAWPLYDTPWGECASEEMEFLLAEMGYSAELLWEEIVPTGKNSLLKSYSEANEYSVDVVAAGAEAGKRNVNVSLSITRMDGTSVSVSKTIKNFKVVSGEENLVKTIDLSVDGLEDLNSDPEKDAQYVIAKDSETARTYVVTASAYNYEDVLFNTSLSWKSSDTSIVKIVDRKDGTAVMTIPKGVYGAATVTVSSKDAGKASESFQVIVADAGVRLATTKININSAADSNFEVYLYPNMQASLGIIPEMQVELVNKDGSLYSDHVFEIQSGDVHTEEGYVVISIPNVPEKASATYTLYLKVTQNIEDVELNSEIVSLKVVDKQSMPKVSAKQTREYNAAAVGSEKYAQFLLTTSDDVSDIELIENGRYQVENTILEYSYDSKGNVQHLVELSLKEPCESTLKKAQFAISYNDYLKEGMVTASVKEIKKTPVISLFAHYLQAPVVYTDLNYPYVEVVLDVPEDMYNEYVQEDVEINEGIVRYGSFKFQLTDSSKLQIAEAKLSDSTLTKDKNGEKTLQGVLIVKLQVLGDTNKFKTANVKFNITDEDERLFEGALSTGTLKVTGKKLSSEKTVLRNVYNSETVTSVTFRESLAGKENLMVYAELPEFFQYVYDDFSYYMTLDVMGDAKAEALIRGGALITEPNGSTLQIITTKEAFNTSKGKLTVTPVIKNFENDTEVKMKSGSLTLNLKNLKSEPKTTVTLKQQGTFNLAAAYTGADIKATVKNLPVGAEIVDVRFKDVSDYDKYELKSLEMSGYGLVSNMEAGFRINQLWNVDLPVGKDTIDVVYDIQLMGGAKIEVNSSVALKVTQSATVKAEFDTNILYNAAAGYGVLVTAVETKANTVESGHGYEVISNVEITNMSELQKAGISYEVNPYRPNEMFFYVDPDLSRGKVKTYTVKAKVSLYDGALDKNGNPMTYPMTFKLVLKK